MTENNELLPCPFCWGIGKYNDSDDYFLVVCNTCHTTVQSSSEKMVKEKWNTRSESESLKSENERLKKALGYAQTQYEKILFGKYPSDIQDDWNKRYCDEITSILKPKGN